MTLADQRVAGLPTTLRGQPRSACVPFVICAGPGSGADLVAQLLRSSGLPVRDPDPGAGLPEAIAAVLTDAERLVPRPAGAGVVATWEDVAPYVRGTGTRTALGSARRPRWSTAYERRLPGLRYLHVIRRDKAALDAEPAELRAADWRWIGFFAWARIEPVTVGYEDLVADRQGSLTAMLESLGLGDPRRPAGSSGSGRTAAMSAPVHSRPLARRRGRPRVSVVVVTHNEGENLALTVGGIRDTSPVDAEIVVVDDWSTDDSVRTLDGLDVRIVRPAERGGVTGSRNHGAQVSTGDVLVFADAHVDPVAGWLDALCGALADPGVACAAPTISQIHQREARGHGFTWREPQLRMAWLRTPRKSVHDVPFICGCLMAFRRTDFESVGGFDAGMVRWGSEDAEIGLNLWRRGRASVVVPQAQVAHLFRPAAPYPVRPDMVVHNALRLATTHLPASAVSRVIDSFRGLACFPAAYARLVDSDVWERRETVGAAARHDGAWFLDRFRIEALR